MAEVASVRQAVTEAERAVGPIDILAPFAGGILLKGPLILMVVGLAAVALVSLAASCGIADAASSAAKTLSMCSFLLPRMNSSSRYWYDWKPLPTGEPNWQIMCAVVPVMIERILDLFGPSLWEFYGASETGMNLPLWKAVALNGLTVVLISDMEISLWLKNR